MPVDIQVGEEELRHIRQDCEARWIFTTRSMADHDCRLVLLDVGQEDKRSFQRYLAEPAETLPAVLFYTSGTTGLPNGVPLTHRYSRGAAVLPGFDCCR